MNKFRMPLLVLLGILVLAALAVVGYRLHMPQEAAKQIPVQPAPESTATKSMELDSQSSRVVDAKTKQPIERAIVTMGDEAVHTDEEGHFELKGHGDTLKFRAPGYAGREIPVSELKSGDIALTPFKVKALYLTVYGTASDKIRNAALETIKNNDLNALVIDVKGDRGFIPFKVDIPLAQEIGAQNKILIKDMPALMASLKEKGLYLIARIVVFKDDMLAGAKPEWAVKMNGGDFRDREKLRWVDPFRHEVWDYNIAIAKQAAKMGFDEVQFDYVRCPDTKGVVFLSLPI